MTAVAELLASAGESAPMQRVRNYHLTDRAARPRVRDFLTAMRRTGGAVCVRWTGPPGDRLVRYVGDDASTDGTGSGGIGSDRTGSDRTGTDRVFVGEAVPERETGRAYYVRQHRRGCRVPKAEATVYELADGEALHAGRAESSESA